MSSDRYKGADKTIKNSHDESQDEKILIKELQEIIDEQRRALHEQKIELQEHKHEIKENMRQIKELEMQHRFQIQHMKMEQEQAIFALQQQLIILQTQMQVALSFPLKASPTNEPRLTSEPTTGSNSDFFKRKY